MTARVRAIRAVAIALLIVSGLLVALLVVFAAAGRDQVILVDAKTTGATLTFSGDQNRWTLTGAKVCTPLADRLPGEERGDGPCDVRAYSTAPLDGDVLEWGNDDEVHVYGGPGRVLALVVVRHKTFIPGTRIVVDMGNWKLGGALTVVGRAVIGGQMANGETHFLLEGRYEMREQSWLSDSTEVVKAGELRRGETVRIVTWPLSADALKDARVFVHITPGEKDALHVSAIAEPSQTALAIEFFGGRAPSLIVPTWIDRALTSPLFIAASVILTIVLGVGQMLMSAITIAIPSDREVLPQPSSDARLAGPETRPEPDVSARKPIPKQKNDPSKPFAGEAVASTLASARNRKTRKPRETG